MIAPWSLFGAPNHLYQTVSNHLITHRIFLKSLRQSRLVMTLAVKVHINRLNVDLIVVAHQNYSV